MGENLHSTDAYDRSRASMSYFSLNYALRQDLWIFMCLFGAAIDWSYADSLEAASIWEILNQNMTISVMEMYVEMSFTKCRL